MGGGGGSANGGDGSLCFLTLSLVGPGGDAGDGGKENREHGPERLIFVAWSQVLRKGVVTPTGESLRLLFNAPR